MAGKYERVVDRQSAHEILSARAEAAAREAAAAEEAALREKDLARREAEAEREFRNARRWDGGRDEAGQSGNPPPRDQQFAQQFAGRGLCQSLARQIGGKAGRTIVRGVLGSLFRSR